MASLILRVSPKSSPVTISFFLSVGALFTASPYRARASRFTASPYSLRLRAIALALRVLEAARYRACDPRRPLGLGNDRSPTPRPAAVFRLRAQIYFRAIQRGSPCTTASRLQVRRNLEPG